MNATAKQTEPSNRAYLSNSSVLLFDQAFPENSGNGNQSWHAAPRFVAPDAPDVSTRPKVVFQGGLAVGKTTPSESNGKFMEMIANAYSMKREPNWDGEGASPITLRTCECAGSFLETIGSRGLPIPRSISPSPLGGIIFQWAKGKQHLSIRVSSRAASSFVVNRIGGKVRKSLSSDILKALFELEEFSKSIG